MGSYLREFQEGGFGRLNTIDKISASASASTSNIPASSRKWIDTSLRMYYLIAHIIARETLVKQVSHTWKCDIHRAPPFYVCTRRVDRSFGRIAGALEPILVADPEPVLLGCSTDQFVLSAGDSLHFPWNEFQTKMNRIIMTNYVRIYLSAVLVGGEQEAFMSSDLLQVEHYRKFIRQRSVSRFLYPTYIHAHRTIIIQEIPHILCTSGRFQRSDVFERSGEPWQDPQS